MSAHEDFPTFPDQPLSDDEVNARLAQYGVALRPSAKGNWPDGWLPGDEPLQISLEGFPPHGGGIEGGGCAGGGDVLGPQRRTPIPNPFPLGKGLSEQLHPAAVFDVHARVRFLDALAGHGNVRAAAARVGVSRETVYRARRRYGDFARCWDAALVHGRARCEDELANRAIDGVAVPVFVRGEHVATYHKHDARYLLAHLARLDRRIAEAPDTVQRAGRFDQLLAAMAGHAPLEDFAEAVESVRERGDTTPPDLPPSREEYAKHARCEAIFESPGDLSAEEQEEFEEAEAEEMAAAEAEAAQAWDAWEAAGAALVDLVLAGESQDSVTCVNTPSEGSVPADPSYGQQAHMDSRLRGNDGIGLE